MAPADDDLLDDADRELLERHPLVEPLSAADRELVLASVALRRPSADEVLIERGDPPGPLVLVLDGTASVLRDDREIGRVTRGSWFGELSLLEDRADRARVVALDDMVVAVVDPSQVERVLSLDEVAAQVDSTARRRRAANRAREAAVVEIPWRGEQTLWLRPLVAADWELFATGDQDRVSERSLRMRFFTTPPLTEARFRQLTDVDLRTAFAWAAFVDDLIVGVGRHVLTAEQPTTAELAVLVADAHQRLGIGRVLVEAAIVAAEVHGATELLALARSSNTGIRRLLGDLGASFVGSDERGVVEARWPVDDALRRIADDPVRRDLEEVARTVLEPVRDA